MDDALAVHHLALDEREPRGIRADEFHEMHDECDEELLPDAGGGPDVNLLRIHEPPGVVDEIESRVHVFARTARHEAAPVIEAQLAPDFEVVAAGCRPAGKHVLV